MYFNEFTVFNKENLDEILKELAKEYRKLGGKMMPAEIILVGGAAIVDNYGFREMTSDIDAVIHAASMMKDAIRAVGERHNLPDDWLNDAFTKTGSYSTKITEVSQYYKSFYNVLDVRTISAEYLVAMKMRSGRKYKNDISDIVGILKAHNRGEDQITFEKIEAAIVKLYGSTDVVSKDIMDFVAETIKNKTYESSYSEIRDSEIENRKILVTFEENYPGVMDENNIEEVLRTLRVKLKEQNEEQNERQNAGQNKAHGGKPERN